MLHKIRDLFPNDEFKAYGSRLFWTILKFFLFIFTELQRILRSGSDSAGMFTLNLFPDLGCLMLTIAFALNYM